MIKYILPFIFCFHYGLSIAQGIFHFRDNRTVEAEYYFIKADTLVYGKHQFSKKNKVHASTLEKLSFPERTEYCVQFDSSEYQLMELIHVGDTKIYEKNNSNYIAVNSPQGMTNVATSGYYFLLKRKEAQLPLRVGYGDKKNQIGKLSAFLSDDSISVARLNDRYFRFDYETLSRLLRDYNYRTGFGNSVVDPSVKAAIYFISIESELKRKQCDIRIEYKNFDKTIKFAGDQLVKVEPSAFENIKITLKDKSNTFGQLQFGEQGNNIYNKVYYDKYYRRCIVTSIDNEKALKIISKNNLAEIGLN